LETTRPAARDEPWRVRRGRETLERNEFLTNIWEAYEAGQLIPVCAWCGRVWIQEQWFAPPGGMLSTIDEPMTLSHSICPTCAAAQPAPSVGRLLLMNKGRAKAATQTRAQIAIEPSADCEAPTQRLGRTRRPTWGSPVL